MTESTKTVVILTVIFYGILKYFIQNSNENFQLAVGAKYLKYHANWTQSIDSAPQLKNFHEALRL